MGLTSDLALFHEELQRPDVSHLVTLYIDLNLLPRSSPHVFCLFQLVPYCPGHIGLDGSGKTFHVNLKGSVEC